MVVALSNLILLLPIGCVLAIMLAMTGDMVQRPRNDAVRVFVHIIVWQFILLGLIGLMARSTYFSLAWAVFAIGFLIQLGYWERGLARNIILLVFGATCHSPKQLSKVVHYLTHEGRGYWRRLGTSFGKVWRSTGSWELAFLHTQLARPARVRLALASLINQQDTAHFHQQVAQLNLEQKQSSQWLGRLLVVSLSYLILLAVGLLEQWVIKPTMLRIWQEFSKEQPMPAIPAWEFIQQWNLHILIPVLVWTTLLSLYLLKNFPSIARHRPIAWLMGDYYRSLAIEGLADRLKSSRDPMLACAKLAEAMPVTMWSRRLRAASQYIYAGQTLPGAFVSSKLLKKNEAATLTLCRDVDSMAWALRELGRSQLERTLNRTHVVVQILTLVLPIIAAVITTFYALSTFKLLMTMIENQL